MSKDLILLSELSVDQIDSILDRGQYWSEENNFRISNTAKVIDNPLVCNLFFESSTRTRFSFEVAAKKLGYHILNFEPSTASTQKGETMYDTLKTLESMGVNVAIIRTKEENILHEVAPKLGLGIINAGAGANEHPTQALLDLLTVRQHFNKIFGLKIAIIGDIKYSRVANSNMIAHTKYGNEILIAGPDFLLPDASSALMTNNVRKCSVDEAILEADVVMMLRVQRERHPRKSDFDWDNPDGQNSYFNQYGLTLERFKKMKPNSIIMHPAPFNRGIEIADEIVEDPKSMIFKQVRNGVAVRMALLERALNR
jgi:aspartate carbamoyltransferase catalytic subunit